MNDPFQDALMDYLEGLENDSRRIESCYNIIKICKRIAVVLQGEGREALSYTNGCRKGKESIRGLENREADVLRGVAQWLTVKGIPHWRVNSGA
jgi:hypothetical protein